MGCLLVISYGWPLAKSGSEPEKKSRGGWMSLEKALGCKSPGMPQKRIPVQNNFLCRKPHKRHMTLRLMIL